jgi:hypothetical protein
LSVDCIQVNSVPVAVVLVANRVAGAVGDSISNCTLPSNLFLCPPQIAVAKAGLSIKGYGFHTF